MICVNINGGLGNQMFQYVCGRSLALRHQTSLILDLSSLNENSGANGTTKRSFELDIFRVNFCEAGVKDLKRSKPLLYRAVNVLAFKLGFNGIQMSKYFVENNFSYNTNIKKAGKDCFLCGYWQSPKYFDSIESLIRDEFTFYDPLEGKNLEIVSMIKKANSVSLHIRRTDFGKAISNNIHGICSLDYYHNAVKYILTQINMPHFFVFSDDIKWAEENLKLPYQSTFISGNDGGKSYIDMQLMSQCKHNIIANSSFSWWGAWLNANPCKIVIAPKQWFSNDNLNAQTNDLIPDRWIRM